MGGWGEAASPGGHSSATGPMGPRSYRRLAAELCMRCRDEDPHVSGVPLSHQRQRRGRADVMKSKRKAKADTKKAKAGGADSKKRLKRKAYDKELARLHGELVKLQEWVKEKGLKVCVVFEGRDGAGKGGTIKAITERVSPRVFRVVALPAPSDREKTQLYAQRYIQHFPAAGEIVIFDRSWYNRTGVEYVMGFCTKDQYKEFVENCPKFESH